jgi:hypothetical protein
VGDAEAGLAGVDPADELVDQLRLVARGGDPGRLLDQDRDPRSSWEMMIVLTSSG